MMKKTTVVTALVLGVVLLTFGEITRPTLAHTPGITRLAALTAPARVIRDSDGVPHIFAASDHDAMLLLGYVHAQDRLFQMDFLRHTFSGTLAEMAGRGALEQDIRNRTLGIRRAADESFSACSPEAQALLQAYADGVNAFLAAPGNPLPAEYAVLRLTKAGVRPWSPVDSLAIIKGVAFQLSFFAEQEILTTVAVAAYQQAGAAGGFDGSLLFFEDVFRIAPFEPTATVPDTSTPATSKLNSARAARSAIDALQDVVRPEALKVAEEYLRKARDPSPPPNLVSAEARPFSNWWIISGKNTDSGFPMMASDPHMPLITPPMFYEVHVVVSDDPTSGAMNVNGVAFPGTPAILTGCNERICWGPTTNPTDVTDVYQEELTLDATGRPQATLYRGVAEPLVAIPQSFLVNRMQSGSVDSFADSGITPSQPGGTTFIVPRRNQGPLLQVDAANRAALSVQYTGFRATRELEGLWLWARAQSIDDFKAGLQLIDAATQNWAYADTSGNIAFFSSAEVPLREDLERLGRADGVPPYLIRDGTGRFRNEWLPMEQRQPGQALEFEVLPAAEMPQAVNPDQGFLLSSNNDPDGTSFDNDPLNTFRPGGGVYYLWGLGYHEGPCRAARVERLIKSRLADGGKISLNDMMRFQANSQMFDAEVLTPYILAAFQNARKDDTPVALKSLAQDPRVAEAVGRLANWDFSTPAGIREGYDPGDDPDSLPEPAEDEIRKSVAATIYSVWRGRILNDTVYATLSRLGLGTCQGCGPNSRQAVAALRNLLDSFPTQHGWGAAGVNFFEVEGAPAPEAARDIAILRALQKALDLLAGDQFAAAYGRSTNLNDYRWGKLHRITFQHVLGNPFTIPAAGGFSHLAPALPGVARAGGFEVVDASNHAGLPGSPQDGTFQDGAARRFVGELTPGGVRGFQIIPGGQSGVPGSPYYANMLGRWLTNRYHPMLLITSEVEANAAVEERFEP